MSASDRRAKLDRYHSDLSIRRQCAMLGVSRSGVYRKPRPANDNDPEAMRRIDVLFTARPFFGARRIARTLTEEGFPIERKRVRRLMRLMGIEALGPKPRTSNPAPGHKIYPYLLRNMTIERPNQVWAADITYIPIGRGFLYLVAVIDWASRAVLSWRLSNTMDASFCLAALEEALARYGKPEIFNTDQGSQFTSADFTGALLQAGVRISMDGRGRWWTTSSSNASGARSSMRTSISKATPTATRRKPGSANILPSTTSGAFIRRTATAPQWPSGAAARSRPPVDMWTTLTR